MFQVIFNKKNSQSTGEKTETSQISLKVKKTPTQETPKHLGDNTLLNSDTTRTKSSKGIKGLKISWWKSLWDSFIYVVKNSFLYRGEDKDDRGQTWYSLDEEGGIKAKIPLKEVRNILEKRPDLILRNMVLTDLTDLEKTRSHDLSYMAEKCLRNEELKEKITKGVSASSEEKNQLKKEALVGIDKFLKIYSHMYKGEEAYNININLKNIYNKCELLLKRQDGKDS